MIVDNRSAGSSKSDGIAEKTTQLVQGVIWTIRSSFEERWMVKIGNVHSICPWIAEHRVFLLSRFEIGHDGKYGKTALEGKLAKSAGNDVRGGNLVEEKTCRRSARKDRLHGGRRAP